MRLPTSSPLKVISTLPHWEHLRHEIVEPDVLGARLVLLAALGREAVACCMSTSLDTALRERLSTAPSIQRTSFTEMSPITANRRSGADSRPSASIVPWPFHHVGVITAVVRL